MPCEDYSDGAVGDVIIWLRGNVVEYLGGGGQGAFSGGSFLGCNCSYSNKKIFLMACA